MSYYIRLLAPAEGVSPAGEIAAALKAEGFDVAVDAAPAGPAWETLTVWPAGQETITGHRTLRQGEENPVDEEIDAFQDELLEREESPGLAQVEDALRRTRQMILLEVPESFPWGEERTVVDALVEFLADSTEALIQADGEGFYDRMGDLLVGME